MNKEQLIDFCEFLHKQSNGRISIHMNTVERYLSSKPIKKDGNLSIVVADRSQPPVVVCPRCRGKEGFRPVGPTSSRCNHCGFIWASDEEETV